MTIVWSAAARKMPIACKRGDKISLQLVCEGYCMYLGSFGAMMFYVHDFSALGIGFKLFATWAL